ncbi:putative transcription factor B3-Domain family [Rosa chinensis]|uniref:Putative transcription factor B3-Domain family n=1 Tax=Rosa chinensis TaxID=74649 RepID=A0A2P6PN00_ROSCH|nr:B3 domain-containing protein Os01g0723500 isoform X1 [Rosa chinensis]PRQ23297.1 putative transcription factor B3-Domain family [Rosa chinensis]
MGRKILRKVTEKKRPTFFQLIHPRLTTEHLRIPPKFTLKYIAKDLSERATLKLERSSECSWSVIVRKSGRDVYFKDGWQEFLRDNSLGDKEFLVFIYDGKMRFSVKIFNKNGCERMDFHNIKAHQNSTVSKSNKRPRGRPRKCSKADSADKEVKEVEEEEDYNDNPAQEYAELFESEVRQFTSTIYVPHNVSIPKSFSTEYLSPGEVSLRNSKGKEWVVKIVDSNGKLCFSAGWKAFAEANQIKFHDVCTFQLVSEKRLVVHICRK